MLNKVILIGRLGGDPELRYTPNGVAVCNFSLAVERNFTNQDGEKEVDWINIVVWRKQAENCSNYITKGSLIAVEGRLQIRSYETNEGQKRRVSEVVASDIRFLEYNDNAPGNQSRDGKMDEDDIDVPF